MDNKPHTKTEHIERELRAAVAEVTGCSATAVTRESSLKDTLGMNGLDIAEVCIEAELRLQFDFPEGVPENLVTFGDLCDSVGKLLP